jgi:hypothetical protein
MRRHRSRAIPTARGARTRWAVLLRRRAILAGQAAGVARTGDQRGQGLVELSAVLPIILILLVGMLEFGMAYNDLLTIGYASREGARAGSALAYGGATSCSPSTDPGGVDKTAIAAVQRILKSPGSDVELSDVQQIRIYKATSTGAQSGSSVNVWTYTPGAGPDVDPGPGTAKLDFTETSHGWNACTRVNSGNPDSIGVQLVYRYRLTTPLGAVLGLIGGSQANTITFREQTVMALNPT